MTSKTKDHLNVDQKNIKINIYDESDYINPIGYVQNEFTHRNNVMEIFVIEKNNCS